MAYTAEKPALARSSQELRTEIPGWGVDLDPKDRPAVPKERFDPNLGGAHWEFPERQVERYPRERSPEHKFLTPVFGTACPPRGLSGAIRKYAYRYSEGRLAHWLLLLGADRVDVLESRLAAIVRGQPDELLRETGVQSELKGGSLRTRLHQRRADNKHHVVDLVRVAATSVSPGTALEVLGRIVARAKRSPGADSHSAP